MYLRSSCSLGCEPANDKVPGNVLHLVNERLGLRTGAREA